MSNTVIFLDIDGVLTQRVTHYELATECVALLRHIVDKTQADIVVSSSWRESAYHMDQLAAMLANFNLTVADTTPIIKLDRSLEIQSWLAQHPDVTNYIILDDEDYNWTAEQSDKVIYTTFAQGLTPKIAELAIKTLTLTAECRTCNSFTN